MTLLLLAILAQTADAALTCRALAQGAREVNPFLPQSCGGIVAIKAGLLAATPIWKGRTQRVYLGSLAAAGSAGVTLTITFGK